VYRTPEPPPPVVLKAPSGSARGFVMGRRRVAADSTRGTFAVAHAARNELGFRQDRRAGVRRIVATMCATFARESCGARGVESRAARPRRHAEQRGEAELAKPANRRRVVSSARPTLCRRRAWQRVLGLIDGHRARRAASEPSASRSACRAPRRSSPRDAEGCDELSRTQ